MMHNAMQYRLIVKSFLGILLSLISSTSLEVLAQSVPITSTDQKISDLQNQINRLDALLQIRQAEAKRATSIGGIVGAERAILDQALPNVEETSRPFNTDELLKEGSLERLKAESRILIYEGVKQISSNIQERIPNGSTVMIYNEDVLKSLIAVREYEIILDSLIEDYEKIIEELRTLQAQPSESENEFGVLGTSQVLRIPEVATKVTRSVIDFLALFRTDVTVETVAIDARNELEQAILISAFASDMKAKKRVNVFFPSLYAPDLALTNVSEIYGKIRTIKELQQETDNLSGKLEMLPEQSEEIRRQKEALSRLNEQVKLLISFEKLPELQLGLKATEILDNENTLILYIDQVLAYGNNQTLTNLFSGLTIRHAGNVMLNYMLFDRQGKIVAADTLYFHSGFQEFDAPRNNLD